MRADVHGSLKEVLLQERLRSFRESAGDMQVSGVSERTKVLGSILAGTFLSGGTRLSSFLLLGDHWEVNPQLSGWHSYHTSAPWWPVLNN